MTDIATMSAAQVIAALDWVVQHRKDAGMQDAAVHTARGHRIRGVEMSEQIKAIGGVGGVTSASVVDWYHQFQSIRPSPSRHLRRSRLRW